MKLKKKIKNKNYLNFKVVQLNNRKKENDSLKRFVKYILMIFFFCIFLLIIYKWFLKKVPSIPSTTSIFSTKSKEKFYFDKYDIEKYNMIKYKLKEECVDMWANQKEFLNGVVRKFKPKKIVEVGCRAGGSSIVMLNAIDDFEDSKLYSIDLDSSEQVGECVNKYFPNLMKKWTLFKGKIAAEYIEQIGNNIDIAFFDTTHVEPGEILDFLMVLPFLKENAVVIFHDIAIQITHSPDRNEWASYIVFNAIRGKKYLPSGDIILKQDIGAIILDSNQNEYYQDYFRLLGGQWQYFPKEEHVSQLRIFFKKYYEKDCPECLIIFEEAIAFNRDFVKRNPKPIRYSFVHD